MSALSQTLRPPGAAPRPLRRRSITIRAQPPFSIQPVVHVIGWFTAVMGLLMVIPAVVDWAASNPDWQVFAVSAATTLFVGVAMVMATQGRQLRLTLQQAFLLTTGVWLASATAGAVPLMFSHLHLSFTDAFFEAMSGITTTGSTVIVGLDSLPPGLQLWRGLLQGYGGIGFIVVGLAMLPFLRVGGMQLFRLESSEKAEKAVPQAKRFAALLLLIYLSLTLTCTFALAIAGMSPLESVVHAMAALSTGGFSTSDGSVSHFASPTIDWILTFFMFVGSLPFILFLRVLQGRPNALWRDQQVRSYLRLLSGVILGLTLWMAFNSDYPVLEALRLVAFNVTSVVTTTGFASTNYQLWGNLPMVVFFFLTFVGGCTGSTAGGLKAFRFDILGLALRGYLLRLIYPHGTFVGAYNGQKVSDDVIAGVLMFMGVYLITFSIASTLLALTGLDLITCVTGAATAISNVGPGLGEIIGPAGNFAPLPATAKWVLSITMLLGRLELFTVFALFAPRFWRQ